MVSETKTRKAKAKLSYDDVKEAIHFICQQNKSQDKILIKLREIQSVLKIKQDIEVSAVTIRDKGVSHRGYFEKKYPNIFSYNYKGNKQNRGLIVKPEKFLDEVSING